MALGNKPDWLSEESRQYPNHLYMRGYGISADLALAKQRAIEALISVFDNETALYFTRAGTPKVQLDKNRLREYFLEHNQIAEVWQDPVSGIFNVLNIMDRVAAGAEFEAGVYRIDRQVERYMEKAGQASDPLQKIAYIQQAMMKQSQREGLLNIVNVIKPTTAVSASQWDEQQIEARLSALLTQIKIKPITAQNDKHLLQALTGGVQDAGFIVDHGPQADYILKATFRQHHLKWEGGIFQLQGDLHLELLDGESSDQVRGAATWPIKVNATERELLTERLNEAVKNINREKFRTTFLGFERN